VTYARHPQGSMPYRRILIALFFAGVATFAQLYSPQGVLPAIAADIGVSPATASLTISVATAGVALSTGAVSLLYFAYLAGTWSSAQVSRWTSRFGRIPTLLVCLATMAGGILLTIAADVPIIVAGIAFATACFFAAHAIGIRLIHRLPFGQDRRSHS
jgi:MFS transporter, YNFM family, putative membrane transport protein